MSELTLFPDFDEDARHLRRNGDPETSAEAARGIVAQLPALHAWAVDCVKQAPGLTQRELGAKFCPTDPRKIGRRLNECEKLGLIRRGTVRKCTVSGRQAETWWPAEEV